MIRSLTTGAAVVTVVGAAVFGGAVLLRDAPSDASARTSPAAIETAELPRATRVIAPPAARFSRSVYGPTSMPGSGLMLDLCRGSVAIDLGGTHPLLVAEHDYCGGAAWIPKLREGETVDLTGKGVQDGRYLVTEVSEAQRRVARFSDLPDDASIVLQTCISDTKIILVGLQPAHNVLVS